MLHSQISKRKTSDSVDCVVHSIAPDLAAGVDCKTILVSLGLT